MASIMNGSDQKRSAVSIVVVAKYPVPGKSKTRLIKMLGDEGSSRLAEAMLADVLTNLSHCKGLHSADKILLYAPPTSEGKYTMKIILHKYEIPTKSENDSTGGGFFLMPMKAGNNLTSSDLGDILHQALVAARERQLKMDRKIGPVIFLGMDSPETPLQELVTIVRKTNESDDSASASAASHKSYTNSYNAHDNAMLLPAADGGYGMLSVPAAADPAKTFQSGIRWSHPLTAVSQIKALTDQSIHVSLGQLMYDIDEPDDVSALCKRLSKTDHLSLENSSEDCLSRLSGVAEADHHGDEFRASCHHTKQCLVSLGQLVD